MLRDLHVRNLAVLAEASLRFGDGLNVLTGETGAGKSLLVDSLALLAGARANADLIRTGAEELVVSGEFEPAGDGWRETLTEAGIAVDEDRVVVRRTISRSGRNRVLVNDQPATLKLLSDLSAALLRIHTQREELGLFEPELQRRWLDASGGADAAGPVEKTAARFRAWREVADRLDRAAGNERLRLERIDLLRFQIGEIDAARLTAGEEDALREERDLLRHGEAIVAALGGSFGELVEEEGAASERIARAARSLDGIAQWQSDATEWVRELEELQVRVEELGRTLQERLDRVDAEPGRLDAIEARLATIERLARKYGRTTAEILELRARLGDELSDLTASEEERGELESRAAAALAEYRAAALELSAARAAWGHALAERIHHELAELAMGKARFAVTLERRGSETSPLTLDGGPVEISEGGIDQVVFQLTANPGEEARPLARVASGGELSRVYLALQLAVGESRGERRPTLVFDEIDSGIGGAEAAALGGKLQRLARERQVLVVTHLPQVASHGDHHFAVHKRYVGGRTEMEVEPLDGAGRVQEVARMLAGKKVTELSRSHAEELIAVAERSR